MHFHSHSHGHADGSKTAPLRSALAITAVFFLIEVVGGFVTGSLALLSDAVHMVNDIAALSLSMFAAWIAQRAPGGSKTYGYYRAEILGALVNGVALWFVVVWIAYEAFQRLGAPPEVHGGGMLVVAVLGLGANAASAWLLAPQKSENLNLRAAFLHVLTDLLGSVGTIAAALIILFTGWQGADTFASLAIALLVLVSSWGLIRESVDILMEAVPKHIDLEQLRRTLEEVAGTERVHDLHVWTLTTGQYALSAHAVVREAGEGERILAQMRDRLHAHFAIDHVTIQLECAQPCEPHSVHL